MRDLYVTIDAAELAGHLERRPAVDPLRSPGLVVHDVSPTAISVGDHRVRATLARRAPDGLAPVSAWGTAQVL